MTCSLATLLASPKEREPGPENVRKDCPTYSINGTAQGKEREVLRVLKKACWVGLSAMVFTSNWSLPVTDFFVPLPLPQFHFASLKKKKKKQKKKRKKIKRPVGKAWEDWSAMCPGDPQILASHLITPAQLLTELLSVLSLASIVQSQVPALSSFLLSWAPEGLSEG